MNFNEYRDSLVEDYFELNEAAFSMSNLKKVADLLAKIASKKLGAKFQPAWADDYKKANGAIGVGFRYMSPEGQQIRFNHVLKSPNTFTVNSVDYWKKGAGLTAPSLTLDFADGINIVQLKNQLFDAIRTGKVPSVSAEDFNESKADQKRARRQEFADQHGIDTSKKVTNAYLLKKADELGLKDAYNDWMKISVNVSEKTKFNEHIREDEKKLGPSGVFADPKYVFQDMEEAAKVIALGKWRSMVIVGAPGIGKCVHGDTEVNIKGL